MAWPLLIMGAVSVLGSVVGGMQKNEASKDEAELTEEQGRILYAEALRDASLIRKDGDMFAKTQSQQYIGAGFMLKGSALLVLEDTRRIANEQADSVERRGAAQSGLSEKEADLHRKAGRAQLVSGIMQGASSAISLYAGGKT